VPGIGTTKRGREAGDDFSVGDVPWTSCNRTCISKILWMICMI